MKLPYLNRQLTALNFSSDQTHDMLEIIRAVFSGFSACVSVRYVYGVPLATHEKYIDQLINKYMISIKHLLCTLSFCSIEHCDSLFDAIKKDMGMIASDAKGDPKIFEHH